MALIIYRYCYLEKLNSWYVVALSSRVCLGLRRRLLVLPLLWLLPAKLDAVVLPLCADVKGGGGQQERRDGERPVTDV